MARRFPPEQASATQARRLVAGVAERWNLHALAHDAALCTAELVTNAVLHAGTPVDLTVIRIGRGLRVEVRDGDPGGAVASTPAVDANLGDQVDDLDADWCRDGLVLSLPPSDEVIEFRRWCAAEIDRQLAGEAPSPCPFEA
ncbi:hypothetical protein BH20ACT2_BH20ACT2_04510 [soil metagenome]